MAIVWSETFFGVLARVSYYPLRDLQKMATPPKLTPLK